MKRTAYIVLGAGAQGVAAAFDLALNGQADRVTLADASLGVARAAARRVRSLVLARGARPPRLTAVGVDARRESDLYRILRGHDGVLSALPYTLNINAARAAIAARAHYVDLGGHFATTQEILRLDRPAQKMGVALTPDAGLAPGLCNVIAAEGCARFDKTHEVRIYCGGLPEHPVAPLGYKKVFNLDGMLGNYFGAATVLRDGQVTTLDGFGEKEMVSFPRPIGTLEAFTTGGATSTAPWTFEGRIQHYTYKTLRHPGHYEAILSLRQLGLLDETPRIVGHQSVVPRRLFVALAEKALHHPEVRDMVVMRVMVRGIKSGVAGQRIFDLLDYEDAATAFSAMQRTTGFSAAVALEQLVGGVVKNQGVSPLERVFPSRPFLEAVQRRGLRIIETSGGGEEGSSSLKNVSGIQ